MTQYLALDLGGTFIKHALIDDSFKVLKEGKEPAGIETEEELLTTLRTIESLYHQQYEAVAVSMPGRIDAEHGIAITGGAYAYMKNWPAQQRFEEIFKAPAHVDNDGKCAAMAELKIGSLKGFDNGVVLVFGTGIGGGLVLDGKVYKGSHFAGGELSFWMGDEDTFCAVDADMKTRFSSLWCMRTSATGLLMDYAKRKGINMKEEGLDGIKFFKAYEEGDQDARDALDLWGRRVAAGIFSMQATLDVERFVLSGGISARSELCEVVNRYVDEYMDARLNFPMTRPDVVTATYRNQANVLGALLFYLEAKNAK